MTATRRSAIDVADVTLPEAVLQAASVQNLLVCGPPMTHKFGVMLRLLGHISDRTVIITTKYPAADVLGAHRALVGAGGTLGVVDVVNDSPGESRRDGDDVVAYVGSPGNLTRIGIEFSKLAETMHGHDEGVQLGVGLHTLDPLTVHAGLQPVYRFLGALTGRVRREGHRSVVVIDIPVADHDVESLRHHFDAVVETRRNQAGEAELRVTGHGHPPSEWTGY